MKTLCLNDLVKLYNLEKKVQKTYEHAECLYDQLENTLSKK